MNKNTMPELFDEQPDGMEQPTQEQILMSESELLRGLIEAGQFFAVSSASSSYPLISLILSMMRSFSGKLKFEFRIRPISEEESLACHDHATKFAPRKRGQPKREIETNMSKFRSWLIYVKFSKISGVAFTRKLHALLMISPGLRFCRSIVPSGGLRRRKTKR